MEPPARRESSRLVRPPRAVRAVFPTGLPSSGFSVLALQYPLRERTFRPAAIDFHFQRVAAAFRRILRNVTEHVELILLFSNALQPAEQIVRIENGESAGSLRQCREDLLIGRDRRRQLRNDARDWL